MKSKFVSRSIGTYRKSVLKLEVDALYASKGKGFGEALFRDAKHWRTISSDAGAGSRNPNAESARPARLVALSNQIAGSKRYLI